jgi:hypothetical protein
MKSSTQPRLAVLGLVAALGLAAAFGASGAVAHHGDRHGGKLLSASLVGSRPSDPAIHTRAAGGVPWDLRRGEVSLARNKFRLRVRGLVITGTDNPGPVTTITASLFCAPDSDATPAFTTSAVPLSSHGDARIEQSVSVPARCLAPVVLVHPNGNTARYIAATGWQL